MLALWNLLINPIGGVAALFLALRTFARWQRLLIRSALRYIWPPRDATICVIVLICIVNTHLTKLVLQTGIFGLKTHIAFLVGIRLPGGLLLLTKYCQLLVGYIRVRRMIQLPEVVQLGLLLRRLVLRMGYFLERQLQHKFDYRKSANSGRSIFGIGNHRDLRLLRQEKSAYLAEADLYSIYFWIQIWKLLELLKGCGHGRKRESAICSSCCLLPRYNCIHVISRSDLLRLAYEHF